MVARHHALSGAVAHKVPLLMCLCAARLRPCVGVLGGGVDLCVLGGGGYGLVDSK